MKTLRNLLQSLSNEENLLLDKILEKGSVTSKKLILRDLLIQKNKLTDFEIAYVLYKHKPNSALSQLKRRLKQDVLDIIAQNSNVLKSGCTYSQDKASCLKSLILCYQLMCRALYDEAEYYLKTGLRIIENRQLVFEKTIYNQLSLELKILYPQSRFDYPDYIADSISLNSMYDAKLEYLSAIDRQNYCRSSQDENTTSESVSLIYKEVSDANLFIIEKIYYENLNEVLSDFLSYNFVSSLINAKELIDFCFTHREFLSEAKKTQAKLLLARSYILNNDYAEAISICTTLDINQHTISSIYWEYMEIQWIAYFLTMNLDACQEIINKLKNSVHRRNKQQHIIWAFFRICLFFRQNKHQELLSLVSQNNKFINNKCPMCLAARLFEIYSLINLGKFNLVSFKLLAFKQLLKRRESCNKSKYQYVLRMLQKLERSNFDFLYIADLLKTKQFSFSTAGQTYEQDLFGYELISFETWILEKCPVNQLTLR